eukprot:3037591-Rhodomonas_salina.1
MRLRDRVAHRSQGRAQRRDLAAAQPKSCPEMASTHALNDGRGASGLAASSAENTAGLDAGSATSSGGWPGSPQSHCEHRPSLSECTAT